MSEPQVYWQRFYVLTVFVLSSVGASIAGNSLFPVAESLKQAFDFNDFDIVLLNTMSWVAFLVFVMPASWFVQKFGIRISMVSSTVFVTLVMILR